MAITPEHDKALSYHPLTPGRGVIVTERAPRIGEG
jgi:hypothetical protein